MGKNSGNRNEVCKYVRALSPWLLRISVVRSGLKSRASYNGMRTVYTVILPQTFGLFLSPEKEKNGLAVLLFIKYSCLNFSGYSFYSLCTP